MAQTITGELYDVYREMGGTEKSRPTIAGMIDLIQQMVAGGGGGGGIFWVTVTFVEYGEGEDERIWSTDKTAAEILAAYNEGKLPIIKRVAAEGMTIDDGAPLVAYPTDIFYDADGDFASAYFNAAVYDSETDIISMTVMVLDDAEGQAEVTVNIYNYSIPTA